MTSNFPIARLLLALVGGFILPGGPTPEPSAVPPGARALTRLPSLPLATAYHLPIAELPEPPTELLAASVDVDAPPAAPGCPVEVRAIVLGESRSDSFAMIAADGDSKLVHRGDGLRARGRELSIAEIDASALMVRVGEALVRCDLSP